MNTLFKSIRYLGFPVLTAILFFSCSPDTKTGSSFPDGKNYAGIQEVEEADNSEDEDVSPLCYESVSSDAYKRTTLHEYIVFWNREGAITGNGSGYDEGEPAWNFTFSGSLTDDSTIKVTVNYTREGTAPFTTSETWIMDDQNEGLRLKNPVQGRPGAEAYFNVEPEDIPEAFQDLLRK